MRDDEFSVLLASKTVACANPDGTLQIGSWRQRFPDGQAHSVLYQIMGALAGSSDCFRHFNGDGFGAVLAPIARGCLYLVLTDWPRQGGPVLLTNWGATELRERGGPLADTVARDAASTLGAA